MIEIPDWQEYCDLVEPDVDLLKTVLEDTNRNKYYDHVTLKLSNKNTCPLFMNQPLLRRP